MAMHLVTAFGLTDGQLQDIEQLAKACNRAEGLAMRLNWPSLRSRGQDRANDFLCYDGDSLVGFLGLFQWVSEEAEATAMTHPAYRRQGIFRKLFDNGLAELRRRGTGSLLFFVDHKSSSAPAVAGAIGAAYAHAENLMEAPPENVRLTPPVPGVELRTAVREDLPELAIIDEEAFGVPANENQFLEQSLTDTGQKFWTVTLDGTVIGKLQARVAERENRIYAFAIKSPYRGRGYGKSALSIAMERLLAERRQRFSLEVLAANEQALGIYRSHGFEVVRRYDYYRMAVE